MIFNQYRVLIIQNPPPHKKNPKKNLQISQVPIDPPINRNNAENSLHHYIPRYY